MESTPNVSTLSDHRQKRTVSWTQNFTSDYLEALGWLTALIHQSEEGQWDESVSQSDESIWRVSEVSCGWVRLFDGRFPGWLMVFWMTDEVDDLVECIGVPELIDWTPPQCTSWISKQTSLSQFCHFYPPFFPLSALVSFIFLKSHFLSLSVFPRPSCLCLFLSPFPFNSISPVLSLHLTLFSFSLYSEISPLFLTLLYFHIHSFFYRSLMFPSLVHVVKIQMSTPNCGHKRDANHVITRAQS